MKQIGFKNFRKFTDFPLRTLGDITLLVGGNNAGKSTFVKAALLLYNFINKKVSDSGSDSLRPEMNFDVTKPFDLNIGTVEKAKNRNAGANDPIIFNFNFKDFLIGIHVKASLFKDKIDPYSTTGNITFVSIKDLNNNIVYSIDYSINRMFLEFESNKANILNIENEYNSSLVELQQYKSNLEDLKQYNNPDFQKIISINKRIKELQDRIQLIAQQKESMINRLELPIYNFIESYGDYYLVNIINSFVSYASLDTPSTIKKNTREYKSFVKNKDVLTSNLSAIQDSQNRLYHMILVTRLEYIYAHAARQVVFLNSKDLNDYMAQTVHDFMVLKANYNKEVSLFIKSWMERFEIGNDFRIEVLGGEAYRVFITTDDGESQLADMGMGSIQLMILLFKLGTFINKYKVGAYSPTILIEEPEQNLHPKLQSKLADLFFELNKKFHYRFIIETHSEYLIRKTQVLVAELGCKDATTLKDSNPFEVYFFSNEKGAFSMEYNYDGSFAKDFEPGFFDEASKLAFKLF